MANEPGKPEPPKEPEKPKEPDKRMIDNSPSCPACGSHYGVFLLDMSVSRNYPPRDNYICFQCCLMFFTDAEHPGKVCLPIFAPRPTEKQKIINEAIRGMEVYGKLNQTLEVFCEYLKKTHRMGDSNDLSNFFNFLLAFASWGATVANERVQYLIDKVKGMEGEK